MFFRIFLFFYVKEKLKYVSLKSKKMSDRECPFSKLLHDIKIHHDKMREDKREEQRKIHFKQQRDCIDKIASQFKKRLEQTDILEKASAEARKGRNYYKVYKQGEFKDDQCIFDALWDDDHSKYARDSIVNICEDVGYQCDIKSSHIYDNYGYTINIKW